MAMTRHLILLFFLLFSISACNKDHLLTDDYNDIQSQHFNNNDYYEFLKLYKSGATGHTLERRTGASYTAAEAHQILETALNEVYCRPRGEYDSLKSNRDTFFITLN